jgi:hypothetical protein
LASSCLPTTATFSDQLFSGFKTIQAAGTPSALVDLLRDPLSH